MVWSGEGRGEGEEGMGSCHQVPLPDRGGVVPLYRFPDVVGYLDAPGLPAGTLHNDVLAIADRTVPARVVLVGQAAVVGGHHAASRICTKICS